MIRAIIFDCFGVLITDALEGILQTIHGRNPALAEQVRGLIRASNKGIIDPAESTRQIAELLGQSESDYRQNIADGEHKNNELLTYILRLRESHKTAMLSNIGRGSLAKRFSTDELKQYFDVVISSGDIGWAKPEPEAYQIAADRLGLRCTECVFIDDRELFCEGARATGMQAIVYRDFAQFSNDLGVLLSQSEK